ncbi:hypothetical protein BDF19DRAFT_445172 [Syncephalis fuscata]|nr:hypothetical protein BDF19DRAFT_445172 [Syncephalis fuscata]
MVANNQHANLLENSCASTSQQGPTLLKQLASHIERGTIDHHLVTHINTSSETHQPAPFRSAVPASKSGTSWNRSKTPQVYSKVASHPLDIYSGQHDNTRINSNTDEEFSEEWNNETITRAVIFDYSALDRVRSAHSTNEVYTQSTIDTPFNTAWSNSQQASKTGEKSVTSPANWSNDFLQQQQQRQGKGLQRPTINTMAPELSEAAQVIMNTQAGLETRRWEWRWDKVFGKDRYQGNQKSSSEDAHLHSTVDATTIDNMTTNTDLIIMQSRRRLKQLLAQFQNS